MSVFSREELEYLAEQRLGRLATICADGLPHVVPLGWSYNPALDTIDIGGRDFARTKKFRNVQANPRAALVIDDVLPPWRPRGVMVRGEAEALEEATGARPLGRSSASTQPRSSAGASAAAPDKTDWGHDPRFRPAVRRTPRCQADGTSRRPKSPNS